MSKRATDVTQFRSVHGAGKLISRRKEAVGPMEPQEMER